MKKGGLADFLKLTEEIRNIGYWGNGDYCIIIYKEDDIDNGIPLIKQSLKINKKQKKTSTASLFVILWEVLKEYLFQCSLAQT